MLGELTLTNFKTHKNTTLKFSPGINVITGDSGQGKTNILLALNWVKDNRPLGKSFIRRGQSDSAEVITKVIDGRETCSVIRRRGKSENLYDIKKDGEVIDPFTSPGNTPPKAISDILNLSDINIQKQRDQHFLVYSSPGQIATYIRSITKLDEIDQVTKLISSKIRSEKSEIARRKEELTAANKKLAILNTIDLELLGRKIVEAKARVLKIKQIKEKMERIELIVKELKILEERRIYIPDNVDKIFEEVDIRQEAASKVSLQLSKLKTLIDKIKKVRVDRIILPDNIDKIFEDVDHSQEAIDRVALQLSKLKILIDKIKKVQARKIVLPENLDILVTVEETSEKYKSLHNRIVVIMDLIEDIHDVRLKIESSGEKFKQLKLEEKQLEEQLSACPSCGVKLTEESKRVLLER